MSTTEHGRSTSIKLVHPRSEAERKEMALLGLLDERGEPRPLSEVVLPDRTRPAIEKVEIENHEILNDAYAYDVPSSFTRGLRVRMKAGSQVLYISGTASIDGTGATVYRGDFGAQCWRTWRNITKLLESQGADWRDIVRTTCYLRDIERDYQDFNEIRTHFFHAMGLQPLPASTGIQARLCREDLLVEIEAIAILEPGDSK
jgi:enamine deaminase RidA (YjgF/YER057c/UK114 family)